MPPDLSFGRWLQQRRKALDMTQADLGDRVGCSAATIRKIEADERRPSKQIAERIAAYLAIPADEYPRFIRYARGELFAPPGNEPVSHVPYLRWRPASQPVINLPIPSSPLIGRTQEIAAICEMLRRPDVRLMSITGPGGIGKTRLALQVAAEMSQEFRSGVVFVPLASIRAPELLLPALADALSLPFQGSSDPHRQLLEYLRTRNLLLVLDNYEQLLPEIQLLTAILQYAPGIKFLVTSRERLRSQWEWLFDVEGLHVPTEHDSDRLEDYSAVQLFLHRTQHLDRRFRLDEHAADVTRICRFVQGLPLGIELAASAVHQRSCREVANQLERNLDHLSTTLRDVPDRHRSIAAVFDHSWNLLSTEEQHVLMRCAVFRGGFTLDAAEHTANATLNLLSALVDKSLVHVGTFGRYDLHELIRQYLIGKLRDLPEEYVRTSERHCAYYAAFLFNQERRLQGAENRAALLDTTAEIENIRASWQWAVLHGKLVSLHKTLGAFQIFFDSRGWFAEAEALVRHAIAALNQTAAHKGTLQAPERMLLGALLTLGGWFETRLGQHEEAKSQVQTGLTLLRPFGPTRDLGNALAYLGTTCLLIGDYTAAQQAFEESIMIYTALGERWLAARSRGAAGVVRLMAGDLDEAQRLSLEAIDELKALGDQRMRALGLGFYGEIMVAQGKYEAAQRLFQESLAISIELEDLWNIGHCFNQLGMVAQARGEYGEAYQLHSEARAVYEEIGDRTYLAISLNYLGSVASLRKHHDEAQRYFAEVLKVAQELKTVPVMIEAATNLAWSLAHTGDPQYAFQLAHLVVQHPAANDQLRERASALLRDIKVRHPSVRIRSAIDTSSISLDVAVQNYLERLR